MLSPHEWRLRTIVGEMVYHPRTLNHDQRKHSGGRKRCLEAHLFMLLIALGATPFEILERQQAYKDIRLAYLPAPLSSKDSQESAETRFESKLRTTKKTASATRLRNGRAERSELRSFLRVPSTGDKMHLPRLFGEAQKCQVKPIHAHAGKHSRSASD